MCNCSVMSCTHSLHIFPPTDWNLRSEWKWEVIISQLAVRRSWDNWWSDPNRQHRHIYDTPEWASFEAIDYPARRRHPVLQLRPREFGSAWTILRFRAVEVLGNRSTQRTSQVVGWVSRQPLARLHAKIPLMRLLDSLSDSKFAEGESLLSFGQRQLFCLARAVLKGSICLILDEATSNLDSETEKQFLKCSTDAFRGKTLITIAVSSLPFGRCNMELQQFALTFPSFRPCFSPQHRLYSLLDYDRVIIMENGKIIEDGNPQELKSNPKSLFTSMLNASDLSGKRDKWKRERWRVASSTSHSTASLFVCKRKWKRQRVEPTHITTEHDSITELFIRLFMARLLWGVINLINDK